MLRPADLDEAVRELELLRSAHRTELAALDDAVIEQVRIARLERLIASATVIDAGGVGDGAAGLGSVVRVRDQAGREAAYELVGRRGHDAAPAQVTPASPVGEALLGARAGDTVRLTLPNGRERSLEVLAVEGP